MQENINESDKNASLIVKANKSFKWSSISEVAAKIFGLLINMILARFIAPEVFGIVASITIIISFSELFAEGGFARFIVQKETDSDSLKKFIGTANVSTIFISMMIFLIILLFKDSLATIVSAEGYGWFLVIAAIQIPLYGFTSIQTAIAKRRFDFGKIAFIRIASTLLRLTISVILAVFGLKIEAILIGSLVSVFLQTIAFLILYRSLLSFKFSIRCLKDMIVISSFYLIETFISWLNTSLDTFLVAFFFNQTTNGIYKNALATSSGLIAIFTSIYTSILISLLARNQYDDDSFNNIIYKYQKIISYLIIPFGIGIFLYRDFLTSVFFGNGWEAAAIVLGVFSLTDCIGTSTGLFIMNGFSAKGKPILNIIINLVGLLWVVLSFTIFARFGFEVFVYVRSLRNIVMSVVSIILGKKILRLKPSIILKNLILPLLFSLPMIAFAFFQVNYFNSVKLCIGGIAICIAIYFLQFFSVSKEDLLDFFRIIKGQQISI